MKINLVFFLIAIIYDCLSFRITILKNINKTRKQYNNSNQHNDQPPPYSQNNNNNQTQNSNLPCNPNIIELCTKECQNNSQTFEKCESFKIDNITTNNVCDCNQ